MLEEPDLCLQGIVKVQEAVPPPKSLCLQARTASCLKGRILTVHNLERALYRVIPVSLLCTSTDISGPREKINLGTQCRRGPEMTVRIMQEATQNMFETKSKIQPVYT